MRKHSVACIIAIGLPVLLIVSLAANIVCPCFVSAESDTTFSVIWITDTQYLSASHPTYYDSLCRWIVANVQTYNIKMVIHTGDIVDTEGNQTQWLNANQSMGILLSSNVPYCWDAGNHDYNSTCWIGYQYVAFSPHAMQNQPYWVGDEFDGMNTAVRFSVNGWDCLIINLAYQANNTALEWANNLLNSNPQSHVIVATHEYLSPQDTYDSWALNFKRTVLDTHANVFLTLNGHFHPTTGNRTRVGDRDELLFNQQDAYGQLGAASARILTFDTEKGQISVQTYVLYANEFLQDPNNNFVLQTKFRNDSANQSVPEFPKPPTTAIVLLLAIPGLAIIITRKIKRN